MHEFFSRTLLSKQDYIAMSDISLSVLIPVYNAEKFLPDCIESLRSQQNKNAEFIFFNDGSTDLSLKILNDFKKIDCRVNVVTSEQNCGTLLARKKLIELARGEYCLFVDPDDFLIGSDCLDNLQQLSKKYKADILKFNIKCVDQTGQNLEHFNTWCNKVEKLATGGGQYRQVVL